MTYIRLLFGVVLAICIASKLTYALNIDAQNYTKCDGSYCSTRLDLSKWLTSPQIASLKASNLSAYLPPRNLSNLKDIRYEFDATPPTSAYLTIYGFIKAYSSVYWTMNLAGYLNVDPWWNYTNTTTLTNPEDLVAGTWATGWYMGLAIFTRSDINITQIEKWSSSTATMVYIYNITTFGCTFNASDRALTLYRSAPINSNLANFTNLTLPKNWCYFIMFNSANANHYHHVGNWNYTGNGYDVYAGSFISNPAGLVGSFDTGGEHFNWYKITAEQNITTFENGTSSTILINNAHANITTECGGTNHNYTAFMNITGLPVSIAYNGTIVNTSNTSAMWYGSLIAGIWNFTANYSGNNTYGGSSDSLIHNITLATPNIDLNFNLSGNSNITCRDLPIMVWCNSTVLEEGVILYNSTNNLTNYYNFTPTSAGTITFTCNNTVGDCYKTNVVSRQLFIQNCDVNLSYSTCANIPDNTITTKYCHTNNTLTQLWNFGNATCYAYETCLSGCDNITQTCKPPIYQQNLIIIIIAVFFVWLIYRLIK